MSLHNKQWLLISLATGEPTPEHFKLVEIEVPDLQDGEVLVRHHYLSLDPYMRGRMTDAKNYATLQPLNEVMIGGTVGEVAASKNPAFAVGDPVVGMGGWQLYQRMAAAELGGLRKVDTNRVPLSAYLGAVGMPGVTAWYGLNRIIEPKAGQTVVVSAASGAVGGTVGQLAKVRGVRRDLAERFAWLPTSVYKAFLHAKQLATEHLDELGVCELALPWVAAEVMETRALMGHDYWPYGIEANRKPLEAMVRYANEQGLIAERPAIEDLFAKGTRIVVKV